MLSISPWPYPRWLGSTAIHPSRAMPGPTLGGETPSSSTMRMDQFSDGAIYEDAELLLAGVETMNLATEALILVNQLDDPVCP